MSLSLLFFDRLAGRLYDHLGAQGSIGRSLDLARVCRGRLQSGHQADSSRQHQSTRRWGGHRDLEALVGLVLVEDLAAPGCWQR